MHKQPQKKAKSAAVFKTATDESGAALSEIAEQVGCIAQELGKIYYIKTMADNMGALASALHAIAHATAASAIAQHGTDEDRAAAMEYLKRWFDPRR